MEVAELAAIAEVVATGTEVSATGSDTGELLGRGASVRVSERLPAADPAAAGSRCFASATGLSKDCSGFGSGFASTTCLGGTAEVLGSFGASCGFCGGGASGCTACCCARDAADLAFSGCTAGTVLLMPHSTTRSLGPPINIRCSVSSRRTSTSRRRASTAAASRTARRGWRLLPPRINVM